jgi:hypothetical protein
MKSLRALIHPASMMCRPAIFRDTIDVFETVITGSKCSDIVTGIETNLFAPTTSHFYAGQSLPV